MMMNGCGGRLLGTWGGILFGFIELIDSIGYRWIFYFYLSMSARVLKLDTFQFSVVLMMNLSVRRTRLNYLSG